MDTSIKFWLPLVIFGLGVGFTLVIITVICGELFNCGCDWPWRGFIEHCNFYIPESTDKCPWCANSFIGKLLQLNHSDN
jgi:hypothetical protein